jgi:hypothetical protein
MIRVGVKGSPKKSMQAALQNEIRSQLPKTAEEIQQAMAAATPKDTGEASRRWHVEEMNTARGEFSVSNSIEYIGVLNAGHSKQAPRNFIEAEALKFGVAKGPIVKYR